jgi:hypothetical protein
VAKVGANEVKHLALQQLDRFACVVYRHTVLHENEGVGRTLQNWKQ